MPTSNVLDPPPPISSHFSFVFYLQWESTPLLTYFHYLCSNHSRKYFSFTQLLHIENLSDIRNSTITIILYIIILTFFDSSKESRSVIISQVFIIFFYSDFLNFRVLIYFLSCEKVSLPFNTLVIFCIVGFTLVWSSR